MSSYLGMRSDRPLSIGDASRAGLRSHTDTALQDDYLHRRPFLAFSIMTNRAGKRTARICIAALSIGAAVGIGTFVAIPMADADAAATHGTDTSATAAIDTLTETDATESARRIVPDGFSDAYYTPDTQGGLLVDPDGDCSSPIPLPAEFDTACKAHDLGYDLIRFGSAAGAPSIAAARKELDARLAIEMNRSCTDRSGIGSRTSCYALAEIASGAVKFNSWRQSYGSPAPEPALPYLIAGAVVAGTAAAGLTTAAASAPRRARRGTSS